MANIDIQNISDLDLNGNSLFDDSESFITELDDNGESIIGGLHPAGTFSDCWDVCHESVLTVCHESIIIG